MSHVPHADYSRYFALKQRAYLINMSEERDREHYESLSGTIVDRGGDMVALQVPYLTEQENSSRQTTYKITTESMGGGIQVMADLVRISTGNVYHLKLRGNLEMYQRRQTPRVDTNLRLFQVRQEATLAVYRKEYRRIVEYMASHGLPPNLRLQEMPINLSAGGLCLSFPPSDQLSQLALFFLDLDDGEAPVCAVAELVWSRLDNDTQLGGHRFLQIRKVDQDRINRYVLARQKDRGQSVAPKTNWELIDRMTYEVPETKPQKKA